MSDVMGGLAATDEYDPFAAEKFIAPPLQDWTAQAASKDVATLKGMGSVLSDALTVPERAIQNSQFAVSTGNYDPRVPVEAALMTMGGGVGGTGEKAGVDLTAGYDPKMWHGVSEIKLPKPVSEMTSVVRPVDKAAETVINPAKLQNSVLMPLLGDRTETAALLDRVNGYQFENPVSLQGGHGYMANNPGKAWAAGKSIAPGIGEVARGAAESGLPVHGVYTAMGERSADFSHMMSDTLAEMAKHTKITPEGEQLFNETMRKIAPDFPGVMSPGVADYLRSSPGELRNVFAKTMDTGKFQKLGFPSAAEARVAVTDPRLLNEPTGAAGLSIARMDPQGSLVPSGHATYDTGIAGNYMGGLAASVPKEVMFPDIVGPLSKHADAVAAARDAAGLKPFRPTEDYLMGRVPKGLPKVQMADQQWVDSVSQHLTDRGFKLGSGATDEKAAAAIQGIRAYHSSPHDFDRFDLSKIGTGEGAQVYGHGLYFAENPAVSGQGGQYWQQFLNRFRQPEQEMAERLQAHGFSRDATAETIQRQIDELQKRIDPGGIFDKPHTADAWRRTQEYIAELSHERDVLKSGQPVGPRTYEVNINADPAHFLDWDKPLSAQPKSVQAIAEDVLRNPGRGVGFVADPTPSAPISGGNLYNALAHRGERNFPAATAAFQEAGIPGIKYLDQGSRPPRSLIDTQNSIKYYNDMLAKEPNNQFAADQLKQYQADLAKHETGSHNYVVFDPRIIDIMRKYGLAGAIGAGGMGALAAQDEYQ